MSELVTDTKRLARATPRIGGAQWFVLPGMPELHTSLVIWGAFAATGLGALGYESMQHLMLVVLTVVTASLALLCWRDCPLPHAATILVLAVPFQLILSVLAAGRLSGNHLYLVFLVAFLIVLNCGRPMRKAGLLRITNSYYLVYLALSLAVYAGVIDLGRELNIFDAARRAPWLGIKTLVGFYGSTAHIDSVSLFVALVNLLYGRGNWRWIFIGLATAACLSAVRFTPFAALGIAIACTWLVWRGTRSAVLRRGLAAGLVIGLTFSAPIAIFASVAFQSTRFDQTVDRATNGRLRIWKAMEEIYIGAPLEKKMFGTGSSEPYYLVGGWPRIHPVTNEVEPLWTANPHNSYLSVLFSLGLVVFLALATALVRLVARMHDWRAHLIAFYVLSVGITNAELFTFLFPIYVVWVFWLHHQGALPRRQAPPTSSARGGPIPAGQGK